jgi:hypothetical protein
LAGRVWKIFGLIMVEGVVRGQYAAVVQGAPVPGGDHLPLRVAVLLLPAQLSEVEELMLERGVLVSHEMVRRWCAKFGQAYANGLRRRRSRPGDKWHLDEVFL